MKHFRLHPNALSSATEIPCIFSTPQYPTSLYAGEEGEMRHWVSECSPVHCLHSPGALSSSLLLLKLGCLRPAPHIIRTSAPHLCRALHIWSPGSSDSGRMLEEEQTGEHSLMLALPLPAVMGKSKAVGHCRSQSYP